MTRIQTARIAFAIAAMLFTAKPFIGFGLHGHLSSPVKTNIVAKIFSKRKIEDGRASMYAIQKILTDPGLNCLLLFGCLLTIIFPLMFKAIESISSRFLQNLQLRLVPQPLALMNRQLLI